MAPARIAGAGATRIASIAGQERRGERRGEADEPRRGRPVRSQSAAKMRAVGT